jgi:hypothetical protein
MSSVSEYQRHARLCSERAQAMINSVDRARWRQLAQEWESLGRITASMPRPELPGLWRGEPPSKTV